MPASDGKVIIDTKLNNKGFVKGVSAMKQDVNSLSSAVSKLGKVMASVFAVREIARFGKAAIELGSNIAEVQNVVDVAFGDMSYKIEDFANTAIQNFGMSRLAAKKTASTYMAMARGMGMSSDAASDMAISLTGLSGDVASFFNISQELADVKLKSVFTGETETLKDLGVVMTQANLKAFALEQGIAKEISAMSQAELVALRYQFVMKQMALAHGDFARTAGSWANQTRTLSMQWQEFMSIVGQTLITVLTPLVKVLNTVVSSLINVANAVNAVVSRIFGGANTQLQQTQSNAAAVGGAISDSVDNQDALTDATKKTAKAQKGLLAGFDEINKLSGDAGGSADVGGINASGLDLGLASGIEEVLSEGEKVDGLLAKMIEATQQWAKSLDFTPIKDAFAYLEAAAQRLAGTLGDALFWAYENVLLPLGKWTIEKALPAAVDLLAAAFDFLRAVLEKLKPVAEWLWDNILQPLAHWTGDLFISALETITSLLKKLTDLLDGNVSIKEFLDSLSIGEELALAFGIAIGIVAAGIAVYNAVMAISAAATGAFAAVLGLLVSPLGLVTAAIAAVILIGIELYKHWDELAPWLKQTWESIKDKAVEIWTAIKTFFSKIWEAIKTEATTIWNGLRSFFSQTWESIRTAASTAWTAIKTLLVGAWEGLKNTATTVWTAIMAFFSKTWESIKNTASAVWNVIKSVLTSLWNSLKTTATTVWGGIKSTISTVWDAVRTNTSAVWGGIKTALSGIWDKLKTTATNTFNGIKDAVTGAWSGLWSGVKDVLNNMLGGVESWINGIIRAINRLLSAISDVAGAIGGRLGFSAPRLNISEVRLPRLAQGAVIPPNREFLAVLGDQKQGANIEAPLDTIVQAFRQAMGELGGSRFGQRELVLKIGEREAGRIVVDLFNQETSRVGVTL